MIIPDSGFPYFSLRDPTITNTSLSLCYPTLALRAMCETKRAKCKLIILYTLHFASVTW
jgi:hypothetical protein